MAGRIKSSFGLLISSPSLCILWLKCCLSYIDPNLCQVYKRDDFNFSNIHKHTEDNRKQESTEENKEREDILWHILLSSYNHLITYKCEVVAHLQEFKFSAFKAPNLQISFSAPIVSSVFQHRPLLSLYLYVLNENLSSVTTSFRNVIFIRMCIWISTGTQSWCQIHFPACNQLRASKAFNFSNDILTSRIFVLLYDILCTRAEDGKLIFWV